MSPMMRILLLVAYFLLFVALGTEYNPPDIVVWAMLAILLALVLYADAALSLPNWYVAMILRIRKAVLRF
jgi:hypothetical protein